MIVDTFIFNNDFNALNIRLNELKDIVDFFIISESAYSHSGIKKKLHLSEDIDFIAKFSHKVIVVTDQRNHLTTNPRIREQIQRQKINRQIKRICKSPSDLIIHSDCDEIPKAQTIEALANQTDVNAILEMRNFSNAINLEHGTWARCRVVTLNKFKSIQGLRQDIFLKNALKQKRSKMPLVFVPDYFTVRRFFLWKFPTFAKSVNIEVIPNGGWHFGNLFNPSEIISKIESSCHTELNTEEIRSQAISNFLEGRDIYRGFQYSKVPIDNTFPEFVLNNPGLFKDLIRE